MLTIVPSFNLICNNISDMSAEFWFLVMLVNFVLNYVIGFIKKRYANQAFLT